jgi:hypothetical protein
MIWNPLSLSFTFLDSFLLLYLPLLELPVSSLALHSSKNQAKRWGLRLSTPLLSIARRLLPKLSPHVAFRYDCLYHSRPLFCWSVSQFIWIHSCCIAMPSRLWECQIMHSRLLSSWVSIGVGVFLCKLDSTPCSMVFEHNILLFNFLP